MRSEKHVLSTLPSRLAPSPLIYPPDTIRIDGRRKRPVRYFGKKKFFSLVASGKTWYWRRAPVVRHLRCGTSGVPDACWGPQGNHPTAIRPSIDPSVDRSARPAPRPPPPPLRLPSQWHWRGIKAWHAWHGNTSFRRDGAIHHTDTAYPPHPPTQAHAQRTHTALPTRTTNPRPRPRPRPPPTARPPRRRNGPVPGGRGGGGGSGCYPALARRRCRA